MTEAVLADLESRARAAIQTGDWAGAVAAFDAVARHQPGDRRTWGNLARAWVLAGDPTAAGLAFRRVLILDPAAFDALELSVSLAEGGHGRGGFDDVRWSWLACADPVRPLALKVMAARLQKRGATLAARDLFARAAHADPGDIDAKVNQALAEIELGNRDAAESALQEALDRDPQESRARYALGWIKLARGDWSGYEDYDARWRQPDADARSRLIPAPLWEGGVVSGGRLVLTDQFGVGDAILFAGLASEAARRAQATTVLEADPRLVPLFA